MNHYATIYECPAWNFSKAGKDHRYLLRLENYTVLPDDVTIDLGEVYQSLYYQLLDEFGVSASEDVILCLERDVLQLETELMLHRSGQVETRLKALRTRLTNATPSNVKDSNIFEISASLSKWAGYDISPLRLSVAEFYSKLKAYEKAMAKN